MAGHRLELIVCLQNNILNAINSQIPGTGVGTITIPITLSSTAPGLVKINSFELTYTMQTVNLDIIWDEGMVLHERSQAYEVVTRHVIGEGATGISGATLDFVASPNSDSPSLTWSETGTLMDDDPADWIIPIQPGQEGGTYTTNNNGIFEIHWRFRVTSEFPEQNNVGFRVTCTDDQGSTPAMLSETVNTGIIVNQSYGLGWLGVRDAEGLVTSQNLTNGAWISAGETIFFQGQMWFSNTEDTPLNSVFDVQIAQKGEQGDFVQSSWKDQNNQNVSFFISFTDWNIIGVPKYVGFLNFVEAFSSPLGIKVLINSAQYTLVYVPGVTLLGLFLALLVDTGIRGVTMFRTLYFLPYITATVAVAISWKWIFATRFGILNAFLGWMGISDPIAWLSNPNFSLLSVAIVMIWKDAGFYMILFLAGLQTCLLYTSPSPRDRTRSRMPSSA